MATGDGYALALRAGAALIDMEFVQFFPIGHLAPRMIGMDPIMWDPFRYKLGGRLLNGAMEEFTDRYGAPEGGRYAITRDLATYAITTLLKVSALFTINIHRLIMHILRPAMKPPWTAS